MKFFAINGSPRKNCNTAQLLDNALEGVKSVFPQASTERIDLYDIPFNGCKSCFACKIKNDDFKPILEKIVRADGIILGSPIYFSDLTGNMRCFLERFMFPFLAYSKTEVVEHNKMPLAFIYTMNATEDISYQIGYHGLFDHFERALSMVFTKPEHLYVYNTYQFRDYSKYVSDAFDETEKRNVRQTQFPKDLENAFELGKRVAIRAEQLD